MLEAILFGAAFFVALALTAVTVIALTIAKAFGKDIDAGAYSVPITLGIITLLAWYGILSWYPLAN